MGTLGHERVGTSGLSITMKIELDNMITTARRVNPGALEDPGLRERIARAYTQIEFTRLLNYRALSKVLKGEKNWPEVPLAKLQWSFLSQTLAELGVDLLGPAGVLAKGGPDAIESGHYTHNYTWQRYTSIGAGTTEVQKNIIADRAIQPPRRSECSGGRHPPSAYGLAPLREETNRRHLSAVNESSGAASVGLASAPRTDPRR